MKGVPATRCKTMCVCVRALRFNFFLMSITRVVLFHLSSFDSVYLLMMWRLKGGKRSNTTKKMGASLSLEHDELGVTRAVNSVTHQ